MKGKIGFKWFDDGFSLTAIEGIGSEELAEWFICDIQTYIPTIDFWKKAMSDVSEGKHREGYYGTGNAHNVFFINQMAFITCEFVEEQAILISYEQLFLVLDQYKQFLESDYSNPNIEPSSIEFEYIAENQEAYKQYLDMGGILENPYKPI